MNVKNKIKSVMVGLGLLGLTTLAYWPNEIKPTSPQAPVIGRQTHFTTNNGTYKIFFERTIEGKQVLQKHNPDSISFSGFGHYKWPDVLTDTNGDGLVDLITKYDIGVSGISVPYPDEIISYPFDKPQIRFTRSKERENEKPLILHRPAEINTKEGKEVYREFLKADKLMYEISKDHR